MIEKFLKIPKEWLLLNFLLIFVSIIFSYYAGFCWITDSLSQFGVHSDFFNFSLIVSGLSLGIFTMSVVEKNKFNWWGRMFLMASSIMLTFIGIFTEEYFIHFIFAISLFTFFPFGLLFFGASLKESNRKLAIFTQSVAVILVLLWVASFVIWMWFYKIGLAIPEIASLVIWVIWCFVFIFNFRNKK